MPRKILSDADTAAKFIPPKATLNQLRDIARGCIGPAEDGRRNSYRDALQQGGNPKYSALDVQSGFSFAIFDCVRKHRPEDEVKADYDDLHRDQEKLHPGRRAQVAHRECGEAEHRQRGRDEP